MSVPPRDNRPCDDQLGRLPLTGPLPYLTEREAHARQLQAGPHPSTTVRWLHATSLAVARVAAYRGLVPSCWRGGDACVVFGEDDRRDVKDRYGDAVIEIRSRALPGQLRAWWVPPTLILGAHHGGRFLSTTELRATPIELMDDVQPCPCPLSRLVAEQQRLWRDTWIQTPAPPSLKPPRS